MSMNAPHKVLHIITSLNLGGAETMMCQLMEQTDRTRFEPHLVSLRPEGPLADRIRAAGVPLHCLDMTSPTSLFSGLGKLTRLMRELQPALVQTWMYHADFLGTLAARRLSPRPPVVWNIQQSNMCPRSSKFLSRALCRLLARLSRSWPERIVNCSRIAIESHVALGYAREKMLHIVNGTDTNRLVPDEVARITLRRELGISEGTPVIGMAGRMDAQKDYPTFFAAIREFIKTDSDTHFVACGAGIVASDPALAKMRNECGAPERVHLLGPRQDMPKVYPAFDIATLSSAYGEGLPLALCEALSCGLPAVVTNVGDSADVVGNSGLVVEPRNPAALAHAWHRLLKLPHAEFAELKIKARERACNHFAIPAITRAYEQLHFEIIQKSTTRESSPASALNVAQRI